MYRLKYYYEVEDLDREIVEIIGEESVTRIRYRFDIDIDKVITDSNMINFEILIRPKKIKMNQAKVDRLKFLFKYYENPLDIYVHKWETIYKDLRQYEIYNSCLRVSNLVVPIQRTHNHNVIIALGTIYGEFIVKKNLIDYSFYTSPTDNFSDGKEYKIETIKNTLKYFGDIGFSASCLTDTDVYGEKYKSTGKVELPKLTYNKDGKVEILKIQ